LDWSASRREKLRQDAKADACDQGRHHRMAIVVAKRACGSHAGRFAALVKRQTSVAIVQL